MVNKLWKYLILIVFLIPLVNAQLDVNFERESYSAGETVQARIVSNVSFVDGISLSKINLTNNNVKVPVAFNLYDLGDNSYYLFFNLPLNLENGNYSLNFGNFIYYDEGLLKSKQLNKNLSVINNKDSILSVYPAFVKLDLEYWERPNIGIKLDNKLNKINLEIPNTTYLISSKNSLALGNSSSFDLSVYLSQDAYKINVISDNLAIKYGNFSYSIPVLVNRKSKPLLVEKLKEEGLNATTVGNGLKFIESADSVNKTLNETTIIRGALRFKNFGANVLHGVNFTLTNKLDDIVRVDYSELDFLNPGDERSVFLHINEKGDINKSYSGDLIVNTKEGPKASFGLNLNLEKKQEIKAAEPEINISNLTKQPATAKKSNMLRNMLITLIIIVFIGIGYFIYRKAKKPKIKLENLFR